MKKIGITGGIGSGKSMIGLILESMGYALFESDRVAKKQYEKREVVHKLEQALKTSLWTGKELDKKKLAEIIFTDTGKLKRVGQIIHPLVAEEFERFLHLHHEECCVFKEAAILIETGQYKNLDAVVLVTAPLKIRVERVVQRDNISREEVLKRIRNQLPQSRLMKYAHFVIVNDGKKLILPQIVKMLEQLNCR
ncbi:MAG: dephospho-CoA kinase [Vicingaceae bacterium]|nr:MAG: dephospho-CoA kinase [Vicingaceae bacterium]GIV41821.1 MAG: dephospho-CoA kinase [Vicingaceae bacterium]